MRLSWNVETPPRAATRRVGDDADGRSHRTYVVNVRVAVVGGGVIGLSIAWRAAREGHEITLYDPEPGQAASWAAAGVLTAGLEPDDPRELVDLKMDSLAMYAGFAGDLAEDSNADPGYYETPNLVLAHADEPERRDHIERVAALADDVGAAYDWLPDGDACVKVEPAVAKADWCGVLIHGDRQADNRRLVTALVTACGNTGVEMVAERVESLDGLQADRVVVTTGPWLNELVPMPEIVPSKGQIVRLRAELDDLPRHMLGGPACYVVPRPHGEVVLGATLEDAGWDTTVTVSGVAEMLNLATDFVPGVARMEFVEAMARLRPRPVSTVMPYIGTPEPGGPIVAAGHFRWGIMLAPITAERVLALLEA